MGFGILFTRPLDYRARRKAGGARSDSPHSIYGSVDRRAAPQHSTIFGAISQGSISAKIDAMLPVIGNLETVG